MITWLFFAVVSFFATLYFHKFLQTKFNVIKPHVKGDFEQFKNNAETGYEMLIQHPVKHAMLQVFFWPIWFAFIAFSFCVLLYYMVIE